MENKIEEYIFNAKLNNDEEIKIKIKKLENSILFKNINDDSFYLNKIYLKEINFENLKKNNIILNTCNNIKEIFDKIINFIQIGENKIKKENDYLIIEISTNNEIQNSINIKLNEENIEEIIKKNIEENNKKLKDEIEELKKKINEKNSIDINIILIFYNFLLFFYNNILENNLSYLFILNCLIYYFEINFLFPIFFNLYIIEFKIFFNFENLDIPKIRLIDYFSVLIYSINFCANHEWKKIIGKQINYFKFFNFLEKITFKKKIE